MHIKLKKVSKYFEKTTMAQVMSLGRLLFSDKEAKPVKNTCIAVDNVSLEIREGERVGIIGHNGAGKTTLLQMIAGLSDCSTGSVEVEGKVNCIMTLGAGLREDLSGMENIFIDGEINGMSRKETSLVADRIVEFADIGEFINYPVRTYSSGMKARLVFAMIIYIEPEILIIDEALSAGDYKFNQKASRKMKEICDKGRIHIIVSHSMVSIVGMCNRCIWLHEGRINMDGDPKVVTNAYLEFVRVEDEKRLQDHFRNKLISNSYALGVEITRVNFVDQYGKTKSIFEVGEPLTIRIEVKTKSLLEKPDLRLIVERIDGIVVIDNKAHSDGLKITPIQGKAVFEIPFKPILFGKQTYRVKVELLDRKGSIENTTMAVRSEILKIENSSYPHNNPIYWSPASWQGMAKSDISLQRFVHNKQVRNL